MKTNQMAVLAIGLVAAMNARADLLVNRGLPTANLNNAAGANRANVDWVQYPTGGANTPNDYAMVGDTFQNTSSQAWNISQITLWTDGGTATSASLWGGVQGSAITVVQSSGAISGPMTYADGSTYQGQSGAYYVLQQINFAVNITLAPGQTYEFFLDGTDPDSGYGLPFVEASNAGLSGSPQDGADGLLLQAEVVNNVVDPSTVTAWTSDAPNTWDKSSDVNVQVYGTVGSPVPEPSTWIAGALLLLPIGVSTFRKFRKARNA